ncbi:hypothetical protein IQ07DRAFT_594520 [Pyrenochaeta sp. DS3sAY3a]|nr:hypothetical protein IQ07DRAFT_594520 [Pyrenochaeta sp. DS3sAY3a]
MAGTIDKIKAKVDNVLHKDKTHDDPTGPHSSHAANKADPRVDSDRIGTAGNTATAGGVGTGQYGAGHGTTGHSTTGGLTGSSTTGGYGTTGHSDPTGPHDSRLANKADPRVDSDRIGTAGNTYGAGHGTTGHSTTGGLTGSSTTGGYGTTGHSDPTGPHDSRLANKLDPRVDSDRVGAAGNTTGAGGYVTGQYGSSTTGGYGTTGHNDPTGPHDSRLANKADPRVDSDRIGTAGNTYGAGHGTTGHGTTGGLTGHSTTGHGTTGGLTGHSTTGHGTTGGLTGSSATGGYSNTPGSGNANKTAGPHNSDLLNKVDPRVDSDLNGSKTYGGNQTYQ